MSGTFEGFWPTIGRAFGAALAVRVCWLVLAFCETRGLRPKESYTWFLTRVHPSLEGSEGPRAKKATGHIGLPN